MIAAIQHPSLNFNDRQCAVSMLVLHYTGMPTRQAALTRLADPVAAVSAHYLVDEDGAIYQLVDEARRAWHAGVSFWAGVTDINSASIGIEIVNPGHEFGYRAFPDRQIAAVINLARDILTRHEIPARNIVAHSDIAPARKQDPGELFPWHILARAGVGLFPAEITTQQASRPAADLSDYGYDTTDLPAAITAFQRHFRPGLINGVWDDDCAARLNWLLTANNPSS